MRLNLSKEHTIRGGNKPIESNVHKTTVNNTIFRIVTKGLYIRPIEAIVREICTNALDGHIAAGTPELPFDVTLPSVINPYFIVRDYGISMDNDTVFNVYAVLGESTKNATSNSIGGWGVGGKSPAAYSDTFFITTYKDGVRRIYQSSCLQNSSPLELLLEGFTDQKNGVEVKIPIKSDDFKRFIRAAETQIAPFDVKPNIITGLSTESDFEYEYDLTKEKTFNITSNLYLPDDDGELVKSPVETPVYFNCTNDKLAIRMGCVVYPINVTSEFFEQYDEKLKAIRGISGCYNFLIDLPVDTVDIKPSREDLDYTDRTNEVLTALISSLYKHYLRQAITIAFHARLLPTNEAISYIFSNSSGDAMAGYIMNKYTTKPDFSDVRMKYSKITDNFAKFTYQIKSDFNKDRDFNFELSVCDGQKTKKIHATDVKFWYTISRSITLVKRDTGYIKKLRYWFDEGELPESGLVDKHRVSRSVQNDWDSTTYTKRDFLVNGNSPKYLVVNDTELADAKEYLGKIFNHVEVVELEDLPKQVKERNRSDNQYSAMRYISTSIYTSDGTEKTINENGYYTIAYLKDRCEEIAEAYDTEVVFTTYNGMHMDESVLKSLCKYHKINVVTFDLPDSFGSRVLKSKNVKFISLENIMNTMFSKIPDKVNAQWKQDLVKRLEYTYVQDKFGYSSRIKSITTVPDIRSYFFKFAPKFVEKPEYAVLASKLLTKKDRFYLERESERVVERMEKRLKLLFKVRPTLALLDVYTDDSLIVELFKLNFKGFNPDANK